MSIVELERGLLQALKAEGSVGAAWGDQVHVRTSSQVVEVDGTPRAASWPFLALRGPTIVENVKRRVAFERERFNANALAATVQVRPFPRYFMVTYAVAMQTRVGFSGTVSAREQYLVAIERWNAWVARTHRVAGFDMIAREPMTADNTQRITPADIHEAVARISFRDVPIYQAEAVTVDTTTQVVVSTQPRLGS